MAKQNLLAQLSQIQPNTLAEFAKKRDLEDMAINGLLADYDHAERKGSRPWMNFIKMQLKKLGHDMDYLAEDHGTGHDRSHY